MPEIYDIVVVGGGPGGLAAGIYGSRARLKTVIIEKGRPGGQASTTEEMENYPGFFKEHTTGPDIMNAFAEHARRFGTEIKQGLVTELELEGPVKKVRTNKGEEYLAHSIILAPGAEPRTLDVKGEGKLRGKGVSYCATCDADFFEELDVVVVGNGDTAIEEAMYLTKFAENVTIIVAHDEGVLGCNKASAEKAFKNPKLHFVWSSTLEEIVGDELVEAVILKNIKTGEISRLETNGVFCFVGTVPKTDFLKGHVQLTPQGYIPTNEMMETNVPGVYAVGDSREKYLRQVVTAAADGAIAAVAAEKYLAEMETLHHQVLAAKGKVLLTFWASRVPASVETVSMLEKLVADSGQGVSLVKMGAFSNKKLADSMGVTAIPTVFLYENGQQIGRLEGDVTQQAVEKLLNQ